MMKRGCPVLGGVIALGVPLCTLLAAGCSKTEEPGSPPGGPPGGPGSGGPMDRPGGRMGGSGGPMGGLGGRRSEPVAANAMAPEIFQQKCQGCHGDHGQGARGPALTKEGDRPSAELRQIIHDGHQKMPAFGKQMTEAQIDAVVAYVKQLGAAKAK